jgi:hypothetical protein
MSQGSDFFAGEVDQIGRRKIDSGGFLGKDGNHHERCLST